MLTESRVAVYNQDNLRYSTKPPYYPPSAYPECPIVPVFDASNRVYHAMREALHLYGLDAAHWGEASMSSEASRYLSCRISFRAPLRGHVL
jgi:hypothetical protein